MLIGELVKKSGLSKDTIRFYEKRKLIMLERHERRGNNYKEYSDRTLATLCQIRKLKNLGFTLSEIRNFIIEETQYKSGCHDLKHTLEEKIDFISDQIRKLSEIKAQLSSSLEKCNSNACELMQS